MTTDFPTDHRMIVGRMVISRKREYRTYLQRRQSPGVDVFGTDTSDEGVETGSEVEGDESRRRERAQNRRFKSLRDAVEEEKRQKRIKIVDFG